MTFELPRSRALNTLPRRKLQERLDEVESRTDLSKSDKHVLLIAYNRYAEANIPIDYWKLKIERDFRGDPRLGEKYADYVSDLQHSYRYGASLCLVGNHGQGKTMVLCNILKKAVQKGYLGLYTTLADIVNVLTVSGGDDKYLAKRELAVVDFLVIDEFDPRFYTSDNAADLYARSLESVFRARAQNKLPTLMASNSPNPIEAFKGMTKESLDSLMKGHLELFTVAPGRDFRKPLVIAPKVELSKTEPDDWPQT